MVENYVSLLLAGIRLKQTPRTGWVQHGVIGAENVAAHTFGVAFTAMLLLELVEQPFNVARVLAMAVLHDLPESLTSDIPSPIKRFFPAELPDLKAKIERAALQELTGDVSFGGDWRELWDEMSAAITPEAKLVHDADKVDMFLQAFAYEQQQGNRQLAAFWRKPHGFYFSEAQAIYDYLVVERNK